MKLATLKNNSQDGELWVVSRDLYRCAPATDIAPTMQAALDNWRYCFAKLQQRYEDLNSELIYGDAFLQENCAPPLPRGATRLRSPTRPCSRWARRRRPWPSRASRRWRAAPATWARRSVRR